MLKINSKKKTQKASSILKPQVAAKKQAPKPEWNSTQSDLDRYKLSRAELVQKKVSMMSKHQFEAKELWLKRQEKLQKGIVDEETQSVMDTCLSTKRPPERNKKNLTYFIKDDNYDNREYLDDNQFEDQSEQQLSLLDLQHEVEPAVKPKPQPKKAKEIEKRQVKDENEEEGGGEFFKKVNQSLKDARDLIGKIERYPSITKSNDPEKALTTLQNSQKENKPRTSSIPKKQGTKATSTSKERKEPLRQSQTSQLGASTNSDRRVDIFDSKSHLAQRKAVEEPKKSLHYDEPEKEEDQEDITQYFKSLKSLNQIEDTIKFLEDNIIGHSDNANQAVAKNKFEEPEHKFESKFEPKFETNKFETSKRESFSPIRKQASPPKKFNYSPQLVSDDRDYLKPRDNFGLSDIKPAKEERDHFEHDQSHEKEMTQEDEQISFDLTMRSEHPEMMTESKRPNFSYDADDFGDHHNEISATLKRPYPTPYQAPYQEPASVSFPQVIFENKTLKNQAPTQPVSQKNFQSQPPAPAAEEDEDDDDLNIERIKGLLQATKNEIEKMNTHSVEVYNSSFKPTSYDDREKENKFSSSNMESQFQGSCGAKSSSYIPEKASNPMKSEVQIQAKKSFDPAWENQRRVLGDISNTHDDFDDDIPAPEPLNVKKYQPSYQPTYKASNNDDSLSIRSFRRK